MDDQLGKFLLAEHKYLGDSFWKNEEVGERRLNFFITLVTAVIAGLVALTTGRDEGLLANTDVYMITVYVLFALLIFGIITLQRMIRRNLVTDQYKRAQDQIRNIFRRAYNKELDDYKPFETGKPRKLGRGGLVEAVAIINSLIVAAFCALFTLSFGTWVAGLIAFLGFISSRWGQHKYIRSRYTK